MKRSLSILVLITGISLTAKAAMSDYDMVVAKDGSGDFTSIQKAIDATKSFPPERITIFIKNGVYREKVKVHSWNTRISLIGESSEKTIITWGDYFDKIDRGRNSTFFTYTLLVEANDFYAENLTVENTAGEVGQAVALHVEADRVYFSHCRFLGNQDTVYAAGEGARQYFEDCYIEGTTDFIFGEATAYFQNCRIHSKKNSYITAASTHPDSETGFVFNNCSLTADPEITKVYLGRPWRPYAQTVFMNSEMGGHILPQGWHNWGKPEAEDQTFYAEYNNSGEGYFPDKRVKWSYQLSKKEATKYRRESVLKDWDPKEFRTKNRF